MATTLGSVITAGALGAGDVTTVGTRLKTRAGLGVYAGCAGFGVQVMGTGRLVFCAADSRESSRLIPRPRGKPAIDGRRLHKRHRLLY